MKKLFLLAFAASAFAACTDNDYHYYELPTSYTVDFESARLGADGYIWGKSQAVTLTEDDAEAMYFGDGSKYFYAPIYTDGDAAFQSLYTDYLGLYGAAYDSWNGFVISNQKDMTTAGFTNDKSVYAPSGANGSAQFAVLYYGKWTGEPYGTPTVHFIGGVKPLSVAVANTTYLYLYFKGDVNPALPVDVKGVFTGYNNGIETGKVEVSLVEGATGSVKAGWETVDLTPLGTVTSMKVIVSTEDSMCPLYLAIDDLQYSK